MKRAYTFLAVVIFTVNAWSQSIEMQESNSTQFAPNTITINEDIIFTNITTGDIVNDGGNSYGVAWGDYDNDGNLDLFVANGGDENNFLYHNNGNGAFTKITSGDIVKDAGSAFAASWGDYDNNGTLDLFVNDELENKLYSNNGDGSFTKIITGEVVSRGGNIASWGDFDNDGNLDLFVASDPTALYQNNGDSTFINVASDDLFYGGIAYNWVDYDNDGDLDLFIVNGDPDQNNFLFRNDNGLEFTRITIGDIGNDLGSSAGGSWGDYDNDGDLDLFVANGGGVANQNNFLYQNNGDGTFIKITSGGIVNDGGYSYSSSWGDFDNDGDLDLFITNNGGGIEQFNFLYSNNGDGTFAKVETGILVNNASFSLGSSWADYDNDGDLDLFVANDGPDNFLYENNGNNNNWINIKCVGTLSNTSAIGAKVRVKANIFGNDTWQMNEISGQTGGGLGSQNSLNAEFGLGDASVIDSIIIEWPNSENWDTINIEMNRFITIVEEKGIIVNLGDDIISCEGETITLDANSYDAYLWKDGSTEQTLEVTTTGIYSVAVTHINGSVSNDEILVTFIPLPSANTSGDTTICDGETNDISIDLTGTAPWNITYTDGAITTSDNPYIFTVSTAGTYEVTAVSDANCTGTNFGNSATVSAEFLPTAGFTYDKNNLIVTFINTSENASSYLWDFGDDNTSTETNPVHSYANVGNYQAELTSMSDNCGNVIETQTIEITTTSIKDFEFNNFVTIIPNPSNGLITLELNNSADEIFIEITAVNGQVVYKKRFNSVNKTEQIDLSENTEGIYFVRVKIKDFEKVGKLIIE